MYKQLRGPERLFRMGQWAVAWLFAYCLMQVGASLIKDLPSVAERPHYEHFLDQEAIGALEQVLAPQQAIGARLQRERAALNGQLQRARQDYRKAKESFDNWRSARSSTKQSAQNPEVVAKARELDAQLAEQQQLEARLARLAQEHQALQAAMAPTQENIQQLKAEARTAYREALKWADLKAFFIRLLFVGPLLGAAIWLFRCYRKTSNWPFVWGFIFFALFAFFFELVPYLPSFGGYIRYGVGALLTFLGGRAMIRGLQRYLERKQQEQHAPQEARKQDIRYEKALKSIAQGQCPSCERAILEVPGAVVNFCMHCGLKIYGTCPQCGLRHNAFFPFCPACGCADETLDALPGNVKKAEERPAS